MLRVGRKGFSFGLFLVKGWLVGTSGVVVSAETRACSSVTAWYLTSDEEHTHGRAGATASACECGRTFPHPEGLQGRERTSKEFIKLKPSGLSGVGVAAAGKICGLQVEASGNENRERWRQTVWRPVSRWEYSLQHILLWIFCTFKTTSCCSNHSGKQSFSSFSRFKCWFQKLFLEIHKKFKYNPNPEELMFSSRVSQQWNWSFQQTVGFCHK